MNKKIIIAIVSLMVIGVVAGAFGFKYIFLSQWNSSGYSNYLYYESEDYNCENELKYIGECPDGKLYSYHMKSIEVIGLSDGKRYALDTAIENGMKIKHILSIMNSSNEDSYSLEKAYSVLATDEKCYVVYPAGININKKQIEKEVQREMCFYAILFATNLERNDNIE